MEFRLGTMNDLQNICSLVAAAIETMEEQGIHQWDKVYPTREDFAHWRTVYTAGLSVGFFRCWLFM